MSPRQLLMASLAATSLLITACSSSKPSSAPTPTVAPGPAPSAGSSSTLFASGSVPTVTGASDLSKEPQIAAGGAAPPAALTGKDLVVGTGTVAGPDATVQVQYVGALYSNGKVFDASWADGGPATFSLNGVVPGFKDAIIGMKIGGRREIVIPPALGYGASGSPPTIPPNSTLVFVIDLLAVQ